MSSRTSLFALFIAVLVILIHTPLLSAAPIPIPASLAGHITTAPTPAVSELGVLLERRATSTHKSSATPATRTRTRIGSAKPKSKSSPTGNWPMPTMKVLVMNNDHPGAKVFSSNVDGVTVMREAATSVLRLLYTPETAPKTVNSVTLLLRSMPNVSYTFGPTADKEIDLSFDWIVASKSRVKDEIRGILAHEMTHIFQYRGKGKCPFGLVEGIADWVRLRSKLQPSTWKEGTGKMDEWDVGYQGTAFFLDWIQRTYGHDDFVRRLNGVMKDREYADTMFEELTGKTVQVLWAEYRAYLKRKQKGGETKT